MVSPVVYLVVAALLVGLILFLTRGRGRAAAGRRCRRARAGGATRPLISSVCVGRGAAAHAHARTCQAQLTRSPRLHLPQAARLSMRARRRPAARCSADASSRTEWQGPYTVFLAPKESVPSSPRPLALPEGQALADTTILQPPPAASVERSTRVSHPCQAGSRAADEKGATKCFLPTCEQKRV